MWLYPLGAMHLGLVSLLQGESWQLLQIIAACGYGKLKVCLIDGCWVLVMGVRLILAVRSGMDSSTFFCIQ